MAMGITSCNRKLFDAFLSEDQSKTFFHGHSFTANPLGCAAALASMDLFDQASTWENVSRISARHAVFLKQIELLPQIKEVRQMGTILAIELQNNEQSSYFNTIRDTAYSFFLKRGIILRPLGNVIYILPPYCIKDENLDYIYLSISEFLQSVVSI